MRASPMQRPASQRSDSVQASPSSQVAALSAVHASASTATWQVWQLLSGLTAWLGMQAPAIWQWSSGQQTSSGACAQVPSAVLQLSTVHGSPSRQPSGQEGAASALPSGEVSAVVSAVVSGSPVTALAVSSPEQAASSAQAASEQSWAMSLERMEGSPKEEFQRSDTGNRCQREPQRLGGLGPGAACVGGALSGEAKTSRGGGRSHPREGLKVGPTRFELATPCTPCKCATRLRHGPQRDWSGVLLSARKVVKGALRPSGVGWPVGIGGIGALAAFRSYTSIAWFTYVSLCFMDCLLFLGRFLRSSPNRSIGRWSVSDSAISHTTCFSTHPKR